MYKEWKYKEMVVMQAGGLLLTRHSGTLCRVPTPAKIRRKKKNDVTLRQSATNNKARTTNWNIRIRRRDWDYSYAQKRLSELFAKARELPSL